MCSQERAKIDWLTAMIRYELQTMKLHRVFEFPDQNRIRGLVSDAINRIPHISSELCQRLRDVIAATNIEDWNAPRPVILRSSIEALRQSCGPKMLACLISWPPSF